MTPVLMPRKFKRREMYIGSSDEMKIRQKQAVDSMVAEAEILILRGEAQRQNLEKLEHQADQLLERMPDQQRSDMISHWERKCIEQADGATKSWQKKREWWRRVVKPIWDPENKTPTRHPFGQNYEDKHGLPRRRPPVVQVEGSAPRQRKPPDHRRDIKGPTLLSRGRREPTSRFSGRPATEKRTFPGRRDDGDNRKWSEAQPPPRMRDRRRHGGPPTSSTRARPPSQRQFYHRDHQEGFPRPRPSYADARQEGFPRPRPSYADAHQEGFPRPRPSYADAHQEGFPRLRPSYADALKTGLRQNREHDEESFQWRQVTRKRRPFFRKRTYYRENQM